MSSVRLPTLTAASRIWPRLCREKQTVRTSWPSAPSHLAGGASQQDTTLELE